MKAINEMTLQEAVDYSVQQIVKQGGRCMEGSVCGYGNEDGQHCAVGWLLDSDNNEMMDFEGDVEDLINEFGHELPEGLIRFPSVFTTLQHIHDKATPEAIPAKVATLAKQGVDTSGEWFKQWVDLRMAQG